jgi:hypothetical protein
VVNALKIIEAEVAAIKNKIGATTTSNTNLPGPVALPDGSAGNTKLPDGLSRDISVAVADAVSRALQPLLVALGGKQSSTSAPTPTVENKTMDDGLYDVNKR